MQLPCFLELEVVKVVFVKHEEAIEAAMVVVQSLLKQVVLKKRKAGWCL